MGYPDYYYYYYYYCHYCHYFGFVNSILFNLLFSLEILFFSNSEFIHTYVAKLLGANPSNEIGSGIFITFHADLP